MIKPVCFLYYEKLEIDKLFLIAISTSCGFRKSMWIGAFKNFEYVITIRFSSFETGDGAITGLFFTVPAEK